MEGSKFWKLSKPEAYLGDKIPSDSDLWDNEIILNPGDALHVPKGWWHVCDTVGLAGSFHVTFTIKEKEQLGIQNESRRQWRRNNRKLEKLEKKVRKRSRLDAPKKFDYFSPEIVYSWKTFSLL